MKILVISDKYKPIQDGAVLGGLEAVVCNTAELLSRNGYDVTIAAPGDSGETRAGIPIFKWTEKSKSYYVGIGEEKRISSRGIVAELIKYIKEQGIDLVLNHNMNPTVIVGLSELDVPLISYCHNAPIYGLGSIATLNGYKESIKKGKFVAGVSKFILDVNNRNIAESTNIIHNQFYVPNALLNVPISNGQDTQRGFIAARLISDKAPDLCIESCIRSGTKLSIAGEIPNNPIKEVEFVNSKVLPLLESSKDSVTFLGSLSHEDVLKNMNNSLFVWEGDFIPAFSLVTAEALAMGTPVIRFGSYGGIQDIIDAVGPEYVISTDFHRKRYPQKVEILSDVITNLKNNYPSQSELDSLAAKTRSVYSEASWISNFKQLLSQTYNIK